jgi:hypothetical protein
MVWAENVLEGTSSSGSDVNRYDVIKTLLD